MLRNILKTAWRNLFKTRIHSFINITGLSIGMAVALLTGVWIVDEASYDKFNDHYDRVARVMQTTTLNGDVSTSYSEPAPLAEELRKNYGEDFRRVALSQWTRDHILSFGDRKFTEKGKFMEPDGPEILSLKMLEGTRAGLRDPASILISASAAKALFGHETALDRIVRIDNKASSRQNLHHMCCQEMGNTAVCHAERPARDSHPGNAGFLFAIVAGHGGTHPECGNKCQRRATNQTHAPSDLETVAD